jgi:hypothetical protein
LEFTPIIDKPMKIQKKRITALNLIQSSTPYGSLKATVNSRNQCENGVQDCQITYLTTVSALSTIEQNNVVMSNQITNNKSNDQLTTRQSRFIDNLLAGGVSAKQCAIDAGYSERSAKVEASRLLKNSKVLHILHQRAKKVLGVRAITALQTVSNLSQNANSEYVRLEASKDLLDRAGLREETDSTQQLNNIQVNIDLG